MTESVNDMVDRLKKAEEQKSKSGDQALALILFLPLTWWLSWSAATVWGWYCASFGLAPITWHQAAGFGVLWSMVFMKRPSKDFTAGDMVSWQFVQAFSCVLGLITGYLFRP